MDSTASIQALLAPAERPIQIQHLAILPDLIVIVIVGADQWAPCPCCSTPARRIHSHYMRTIADLPWRAIPVVLRWDVRRFFCDNAECNRRIFAEQLVQLVGRRQRSTKQFDQQLARIGITCGGEPGARLAADLGMLTSGDTILRRERIKGHSYF